MTETRVEVVVTVPEELPRDLLVPTAMRTTLGVLVELITEGRNRVILASPFLQLASIYRGPLGVALGTAVARGVLIDVVSMRVERVELLLETLVAALARVDGAARGWYCGRLFPVVLSPAHGLPPILKNRKPFMCEPVTALATAVSDG